MTSDFERKLTAMTPRIQILPKKIRQIPQSAGLVAAGFLLGVIATYFILPPEKIMSEPIPKPHRDDSAVTVFVLDDNVISELRYSADVCCLVAKRIPIETPPPPDYCYRTLFKQFNKTFKP
jgi:hypothetical protein